jgi:hypothetical protein
LSVISFVDNDVILKLTACDLFWDAIALLKVQPSDVKVLDSAQYVIKKKKEIKQRYSEEIREKAIDLVKTLTQIEADPLNPFLALQQIKGLDVGELNLTYAAISEPAFYLVTGDKKFMRKLSEVPEMAIAREKLNGRVICFEQLIHKLIIVKGFETVKQKVLPVKDCCDTALKSAFGSGDRAEEVNVIDSLGQYIQDLKRDCPNLLIDF